MWIETKRNGSLNLNNVVGVRWCFQETEAELFAYTDPAHCYDSGVSIIQGSKEECKTVMEFISEKMNVYHVEDILKDKTEEEV